MSSAEVAEVADELPTELLVLLSSIDEVAEVVFIGPLSMRESHFFISPWCWVNQDLRL